jgi:hypothetical protein
MPTLTLSGPLPQPDMLGADVVAISVDPLAKDGAGLAFVTYQPKDAAGNVVGFPERAAVALPDGALSAILAALGMKGA